MEWMRSNVNYMIWSIWLPNLEFWVSQWRKQEKLLYAHGKARYGKEGRSTGQAGCGLPVTTITTDNGSEFAAHRIIARELNTTVYFAHPYSSWEKGAIENMNGLIRQYIPKKTDFWGITKQYIRHVMEKLNNRPRKKNGFEKPKDLIKERIT